MKGRVVCRPNLLSTKQGAFIHHDLVEQGVVHEGLFSRLSRLEHNLQLLVLSTSRKSLYMPLSLLRYEDELLSRLEIARFC